ncbi:MAG: 3-oxoacyl-ACP synthase III [Planctomycetes bacterium]|nr:3-oxoacyl-ACP synthase III [Planctomycetota bacterium]MCC8115606.1 3-oxoacyl-ACP synthase III [Planctomycetota bacterium]MCD7895444.1 3-oxoacyl-ACP synthase III [Planctomycetaceae bacterium]
MLFRNTSVAAITLVKPPRVVTSLEIEARLAPVYDRLKLSAGRLELMTGIFERRFWNPGTRSSAVAAEAGERALRQSGIDRSRIGCCILASVCRDFLEPATASLVHEMLGLGEDCAIFDLSNACLGVLNGMAVVATMIDAGQIDAGIVVSGEVAEPLHDATMNALLSDRHPDKRRLKDQFASLTIGSAAVAVVLVRDGLVPGHRLIGGMVGTDSGGNKLCKADPGLALPEGPIMNTDSEGLLHAGCALAARTWERTKAELGWTNDTPAHIFTHQVGRAHAKLTLETLGLGEDRDFPTVMYMGNTGSAALPGAVALGLAHKAMKNGDILALLGIGSGLSCMMLGMEYRA